MLLSLVFTLVVFITGGGIFVLVWLLIHVFSFAMIQADCYRQILHKPATNPGATIQPRRKLLWQWTKHFLLSGLVLFGLIVTAVAIADGLLDFSKNASVALSLIPAILVMPVLMRLALVLPAWSGGETFTYVDAWEVSDDLGWPMAIITSIVLFLLVAATFACLVVLAAIGLNRSSAFGFIGFLGLETILFGLAYANAIVLSVGYQFAKARWFAKQPKAENLKTM
ncbi:hypothetical protein [Roseibium sp.]|uniref:hypothetical protein n=1 Tax=Roseibium sp. TaxID=1936156 RepID=UPI003B518CF3